VNLAKMKGRDCSICVGSESVVPSTIVRDLGVHLDEELTLKQHVAKVAASVSTIFVVYAKFTGELGLK
jgi:hypothetical protein